MAVRKVGGYVSINKIFGKPVYIFSTSTVERGSVVILGKVRFV